MIDAGEQYWERTRDGRTKRIQVPMQTDIFNGRVALVAEEIIAELLRDGGWNLISDSMHSEATE